MAISSTQTFLSRVFILFLFFQSQTFTVQPRSLKPHGRLAFARSYLKAYGYLSDDHHQHDDGNDVMESGIKKFQEFYSLNVSGKLDHETLEAMDQPRCGVPDEMLSKKSFLNNSKFSFFSGKPTWPSSKRNLSYAFKSGVDVVPLDVLRSVFLIVFAQWSGATKFTFNEVVIEKTDLTIGLYRGAHGDGKPFDGPGHILAHAFAPTDGRLHYDADEKWSDQNPTPAGQFDLVWIGLHEVGHLLGLQHSKDPNAVMYAFMQPGKSKRALGSDDIAGIKALYPN
ncbi:metalloendoproteinase 5-MMP-like [Neltuma alba]|uniref:metalloendoproteinase 5-MMP-like n=1 Tax=Neltuma alba TaxID=207710 RepID=UPI0010A45134|nr:metalloendoproteinase 5-MMP-like [Prosopis alba]